MDIINGKILKGMIFSGANNLNNQKNNIDALNVFPVPDGDTGTNMSMTFSNGLQEVKKLSDDNLSVVAKTLSRGLLMGARGNSGVILSQIFRGFYQSVDGKETVDAKDLAEAFNKGSQVAYKAVMRPVEGTILTVIRESAYYAGNYVETHPNCNITEYFNILCKEAKISLDNTPELLPVLKEVGVVDSGATGLLTILEGFKLFLEGNPVEVQDVETTNEASQLEIENEGFGYCTEFILRLDEKSLKTFKEEKLRELMGKLGDSLVVVQDEDLVKVHVHTLTPGEALNVAQRYGEFVKLKIENMQEQHNHIVNKDLKVENIKEEKAAIDVMEEKDYAIIAVAAGDGLVDLFKEYRVDKVISGGQTMNPSTEDFTDAIKAINAKQIFILPNNSNIILAAKQAASIMEDLNIHVFETKSIPQGLSACLMFNPEATPEENIDEMLNAINHVKTGQVTYAIKDTSFDGIQISSGDYMGIKEKEIVVSVKDKIEATKALLNSMIDENSEIVTIIYGEDVSEDEINSISSYVEETFNIETDVQNGKQPVYSFIIGVE
ncbi:MAG: DAK2 domain-containing protein [Erysipelotrichaceae bacterium]|nr:DAK2 domain-containing protein [Erysipelotrichaceae bacterium]